MTKLNRLAKMLQLPSKIVQQFCLLRDDPERFAWNVIQYTHPSLFERRLSDTLSCPPMHIVVEKSDLGPPVLNILDTAWTTSGMTGGPNTVVNLAGRIARLGVRVRLVSTSKSTSIEVAWLRRHLEQLLGSADFPDITLASAASAATPLSVGPRDVFLATHWLTAQQLKRVLPDLPVKCFFYMLQEFEPGFYPWSSNYALAFETLSMDFVPIINEKLLAEYFFAQRPGSFADPRMAERMVVFEPAVDRALFHPATGQAARPRRLLFYARPTNTRNLFGLGLMALRQVAALPVFDGWEFLSIGSRGGVPDLDLGGGRWLRRAPWMDYRGYAELLRQSDVLLCPMLSPHTSYPVLEMVACGGWAVTNSFETKTSQALTALSANIIATAPTVDGLAEGLRVAAARASSGAREDAKHNVTGDWSHALDPVALRVVSALRQWTASI